ncbi:multiple epidermal growth factor-like domains protein 11 isoform X1 [Bombus huntii]|uniref:multiple epidermal growth factor-like domains protein 11 isoform X1 n=1 Tax=Bombus huntii TaxID=85661 RepID=UPI0021AAB321|nr:multiple epidermal growth factor-like domains protein 11 isoform X1 [Bombus huntii]
MNERMRNMRYIGGIIFINSILITGVMMSSWSTRQPKNELDDSDHECIVRFSRREERFVPYTETYKARKWGLFYVIKTRTNYRSEYRTTWVTEKTCCNGYVKNDNVCVPVCSVPCINAKCVKPNTCECEEGFRQQYVSFACEPVCEGNCKNGVCQSPNKCMCNTGYELSADKLHCQPICQQNCEQLNARCVGPNHCVCNPGYELSDLLCKPICKMPCENGKCTAPDVCTCNDGYELMDMFTCTPKCEQPCKYGNCTAPNNCTCNPGYQQNEAKDCEPICSESCVNGTCIAPEVCSCDPGYGLLNDSKYVCEPMCEKACVNGTCTAPDICSCHDGYQVSGDDTMKHVCEPICEKPCGNGTCTAPGVCNCTEGYWFEEEERTCLPFCKIPCEPGGTCVAPDTCSCFDGYRTIDTNVKENEVLDKITDGYISACEPICEPSCKHGKCTAPNFCTCNDNYTRSSDNRCMPICSSCENGICVAPHVCQCLEGFVKESEGSCVAFCENSCENGKCVAPNECRCDVGFELSANGTCVKPCTRVCKGHGVCVKDEEPCECSYGWTGWDCDQPTVCILVMDFDDKTVNRLTVHNETNSTQMDARHYAPYCYQCNDTEGNKSFCFTITSDHGPSTIGCFVERESPCYLSMYHSSTNTVSRMVGTLTAITIVIIATATTAAYFFIRRQRKMKTRAAIVQNDLYQETITHEANECLISEDESHDAIVNDTGIN